MNFKINHALCKTKCFYLLLFGIFIIMITPSNAQECNSCTIIGDSYLFLDDIKNYKTQEKSGYSYFWSTTGGLEIIWGNKNSSVYVQGLTKEPGKLCITSYKNGEEPCTFCREIKVVDPYECRLFGAGIEPYGTSSRCSSIGFKVFTNLGEESDCDLNYRWFVDDGEIVSGQGTSTIFIDTDISNPKVGVKVGTCCGFYTIASFNAACDLCNQPEPCLE